MVMFVISLVAFAIQDRLGDPLRGLPVSRFQNRSASAA